MNLYVLVEGEAAEKRIYRAWLSHCLPGITEVPSVSAIAKDHFYLLAGNGYPSYMDRIPRAIDDIVGHGQIDHFLICVDAEDFTRNEKVAEIQTILDRCTYFRNTHIIVADCCIETWLLGHETIVRANPQNEALRAFKKHYDVRVYDPEEMPGTAEYQTRAQFHFEYLRAVFREQNLTYSKTRGGHWLEPGYYEALRTRWTKTRHIASFGHFASLMDQIA